MIYIFADIAGRAGDRNRIGLHWLAKRPRKAAPAGGKARQLNVRVSDGERLAIEAAAREAGMSASAFFRGLLLEGAGVRPIFTADDRAALQVLHEDMRMIGINLNQVARSLNSGRVIHTEEIRIALENVQKAQTALMFELTRAARQAARSRRGAD